MTADNFIQRAAHGIWNFMRTPKFEYEIQSKKKNKHFYSVYDFSLSTSFSMALHYILLNRNKMSINIQLVGFLSIERGYFSLFSGLF